MSTGNGSVTSSVANIALPSQSCASAPAAQSGGAVASASSSQAAQYEQYYSSAEYQQYYQQYYANAYPQPTAYAHQQYAPYYQAGASTSSMYGGAMYGQAQAASAYLPAAYQAAATSQAGTTTLATAEDANDDEDDDDDDDPTIAKSQNSKASNTLTYSCNAKMGLNPLIYTNIQQSPYFKNNLFQLKTYHEVIDEIYYNVKHLEPWEKGSRKVSGQTGMCGSVRGVGAGGIISTPFCILFKLYTLKLTRKQVNGLIRHKDSPFIRGLGFMFIRYTQPAQDLWQWFEPFLDDAEEIDPKAGGGSPMSVGEMVRYMLTKLDWFSTLFPRIPIPIQKEIEEKLRNYDKDANPNYEEYDDDSGSTSKEKKNGDERADRDTEAHYKHYRSESKYSKSESRSRRSRSRSPSKHYDNKRSRKYEDDRRSDSDRSNRHKSNRYY